MVTIVELRCTCGAAPVQFEGALSNGKHFYFRARWQVWEFGIGATYDAAVEATMQLEPEGFARSGAYGEQMFAASYMPSTVAIALIERCVREYADSQEHING